MTTQLRDIAEQAVQEPLETETSTETEQPTPAPTEEEVKPFAEKGDLTGRTPEQLDEIYAKWNKSYTQTRQKEKAEIKAMKEEYERRIAEFEASKAKTAEPEVKSNASDSVRATEEVLNAFKEGRISAQELELYMKGIYEDEAKKIAEEVYTQKTQVQQEEQYQQKALESFFSVDERLNENSPNFSPRMQKQIGAEMAELLDAYIAEKGTAIGFDAASETKRLVEAYDAEIDELVKERTLQAQAQAKAKAERSARTEIRGNTAPTVSTKPLDRRAILEKALEDTVG